METKKLNGADYLLLLLYLDNQKPIKGAIRLTKMMFLLENEILPELKKKGLDAEKMPGFLAYNFGPFSKELYEQIDFFANIKFIEAIDIKATEEMGEVDDWNGEWFNNADEPVDLGISIDSKYMQYTLLPLGKAYVEKKILATTLLTDEQRKILEVFKSKIVKTSAKDILRYVYTKYPASAVNSLIKKDIIGDGDED